MNPNLPFLASDDGRRARRIAASAQVPRRSGPRVVIDPRIYEILDHGVRVGALSAALARKLGLAESHVECIAEAAVNHDIGKLLLPPALLFSIARLSNDERLTIQRHAQWGATLIQIMAIVPVAGSRIYNNVCRYHHERCDGTGYPEGLKGDAIPLEARIVALADVFDALTSSRSYKQPWSIEDAFMFICAQAGSHFDRAVVDAFRALYDEGLLSGTVTGASAMLTRARHLFIKAAALVQCGVQGTTRLAWTSTTADPLYPERVAFASFVDSAVLHIGRSERAARLTAQRRPTP